MRRITGCLPLAAALLVLAGCGDDSDGGSAAETTPTAEASEQPEPTDEPTDEPVADDEASCSTDDPPQITVADPGAEPRSVMELSPTAGETVELDMTVHTETTQTLGGEAQPQQEIPAMIFGLAVTIDEVTDEQISMSVVYDRAEFDSDDPQLQAAMESMVGITSTLVTDRSGVFIDGNVDTASVDDPALAATIDQMGAQLEQLAFPLPTEPVGAGAVWDVATAIDSNGVVFCSTTTYRLTEFDGDAYAFETEVTQQAQPTTLEQGTATIEVLEGTGSGSGTSTGSLSFPMAVSASSTASNTMLLLVEDGSDQGEIGTDLTLEMQLTRRE